MAAPGSASAPVLVERFDNVVQLTWLHSEPLSAGGASGEEAPARRQAIPARWSPRPLHAALAQLRQHADDVGLLLACLLAVVLGGHLPHLTGGQ